ncbi:MAG: DUF1018 domain-containing protein [Spirochaetales bacterium]|nr:DUF1018 domain-containing protein [Spirochaetales bacterium]
MATAKQIQIIHVLKQKIGLDDETYRQLLAGFMCGSSKDLSEKDAAVLIHRLNQSPSKSKGTGFATGKQLFAIKMMWKLISRKVTQQEKDDALAVLVRRKFGKELSDLSRQEASELIVTLHNWGGKK